FRGAAVPTHSVESLRNRGRAAVRQTRNDGSACKHFRVGRQHGCRHRTACRETRDEDTLSIESVPEDHRLDHLPYRKHLAPIAHGIGWIKPVETKVRIVGTLLLGKKQGKPG